MSDPRDVNSTGGDEDDEPGGTVDALSVFYVIGGIPMMIAFFVCLFLIVGSCDGSNIEIPV